LGQLVSVSDSPQIELKLGNDVRSQLPLLPPIQVLIRDHGKAITATALHYQAIELSWGSLGFTITLPLLDVLPEQLVDHQIEVFGHGESATTAT
jgi:hypothetical protein